MVALVDGVPRTSTRCRRPRRPSARGHVRRAVRACPAPARGMAFGGCFIALMQPDAVIDVIQSSNREVAKSWCRSSRRRRDPGVGDPHQLAADRARSDAINRSTPDRHDAIPRVARAVGDEANVRALTARSCWRSSERFTGAAPHRDRAVRGRARISSTSIIADREDGHYDDRAGHIGRGCRRRPTREMLQGVVLTGKGLRHGDQDEHLRARPIDFLLFFTNRGRSTACVAERLEAPASPWAVRWSTSRRCGEKTSCSLRFDVDFRVGVPRVRHGKGGHEEDEALEACWKMISMTASRSRSATTTTIAVAPRRCGDEIYEVFMSASRCASRKAEGRTWPRHRVASAGWDVGEGRGHRHGRRTRRHGHAGRPTEATWQAHKIDQYRKTSRGAKGVLTIKLTEAKGGPPVRWSSGPHQELVFISAERDDPARGHQGICSRVAGHGRSRREPGARTTR